MAANIALIPAYCPTEGLLGLVQQLQNTGFTVVVVDDGSGPDYQHIFDKLKDTAHILSYLPNQGKGHALKEGYAYIAEHMGDGFIVTLDADGQHTPTDACRVLELAKAHPEALALGVRSFGKGTPARSMFGNTLTRSVYRISTGTRVSDTQTGLRAFSTALLPLMRTIPGERYEYEMNVLMICPRKNVSIVETEIATIYEDGNKGSHFQPVRDSIRIYKHILKYMLSSFSSFLVDYGLYSLLVILFGKFGVSGSFYIPFCNIAARITSGSLNFGLNKRFVFRNKDSIWKTGTEYCIVAVSIMLLNTVLLSFMVNSWEVNKYLAKLVTEVTFFGLSWLAQKYWIFRKRKKDA